MDSFPMMLAAHYYRKTIPSVNNPPTWLVCPLHTCEACLQAYDSLSLSVHLSKDGRRAEVHLCTQICKQPLPKVGSELNIFVRYYCLWKSMQFEYLLHEDLCNVTASYVDLTSIKCAAFVNLSTTTMMESCCLQVIDNPVIKSMEIILISIPELAKVATNL